MHPVLYRNQHWKPASAISPLAYFFPLACV